MEEITVDTMNNGKSELDPDELWEKVEAKYRKEQPETFDDKTMPKKIRDVREAMKTLWVDKKYSPFHCKPLAVEKRIDIELKDLGVTLIGYIDRIQEEDEDTITIFDLKSGRQKAFSTRFDTPKMTEDDLWDNIQLQIYAYAAKKFYPDKKNIYATLYFVKEDGPLTIKISDIPEEKILKKLSYYVRKVRANESPKRNTGFHCKWCDYGPKFGDPCGDIHKEIKACGIQSVELTYSAINTRDKK